MIGPRLRSLIRTNRIKASGVPALAAHVIRQRSLCGLRDRRSRIAVSALPPQPLVRDWDRRPEEELRFDMQRRLGRRQCRFPVELCVLRRCLE